MSVLRRPLHKFSNIFLHISVLWWVMRKRFVFGRLCGGEIDLNVHNPGAYATWWPSLLEVLGVSWETRPYGKLLASLCLWIVWWMKNTKIFEEKWRMVETLWDLLHISIPPYEVLVLLLLKASPSMLLNLIGVWLVIRFCIGFLVWRRSLCNILIGFLYFVGRIPHPLTLFINICYFIVSVEKNVHAKLV